MAYFLGMITPLIVINIITYLFRDKLNEKGWIKRDMYWKTMFGASLGAFIGLYIINYM